MAGAKGRSGGRRPGAGRKAENTANYQTAMRDLFQQCVRPEDWQTVIWTALARAKAGDKAAREWLSAWIVGKVPDEVKHEQSGKVVVEVAYVDGKSKS